MNTLRRTTRHMAKAVAAGAVLLAAAIPVAVAGLASAATAPTLTCTSDTGVCTSGYAVVGTGFSGTIYLTGTGFANDAGTGGTVTVSSSATGVTFSGAADYSSTGATATITVPSSATPGFYSVTYTDTNGTVTLPLGLGIDQGPEITAVTGNTGTAGGSATTVTLTGSGFTGSSASITGTGAPTLSGYTVASDTSASFSVNPSAATAGTYTFTITGATPAFSPGAVTGSYTVNAAAPSTTTITSVTELATVTSGTSSENFTITGTGFKTGAVVNVYAGGSCATTCATASGITLSGSTTTVSSATSITISGASVTQTTAAQYDVVVINTDASNATLAKGLGIGEPGATGTSTSTSPTAPSILAPATYAGSFTGLQASTSTIAYIQGSTTFPLSTGTTVSLSSTTSGAAPSLTVPGTVVSVDGTNTATLKFLIPAYAGTTLTAAALAGATTIAATNTVGFPASGSVTFVDGASTETVAYSANSGTGLTTTATAFAHAAGTPIIFSFPAGTYTLTANNGTNTEKTTANVLAAPVSSITDAVGNASSGDALAPGTYSLTAYEPGFNFGTGSSFTVTGSNATATVTPVNANTATITVTVPSTESFSTSTTAAISVNTGNIPMASVAGLAVGSVITVDGGTSAAETLTVASTWNGTSLTVPVTTLTKNAHNAGASVTYNVAQGSQVISGVLANGSGFALPIATLAHTAAAPVAATASPSALESGAYALPVTFTTPSQSDTTNANWSVTTTSPGVTFKVVPQTTTAMTSTTLPTTVTIAPGTPVAASVPVTITDGVSIFTATVSITTGPTITSVTSVGSLTAGGSETIGAYGTGFNATVASNTCYFTNGGVKDTAVTCSVVSTVTDSTTALTLSVSVGGAALNGSDTLVINNGSALATLAAALTVTGQPTITGVTPGSVVAGLSPIAFTITGTGFSGAPTVSMAEYNSAGTFVSSSSLTFGSVALTGTTTITFSTTGNSTVPGDVVVLTVTDAGSSVSSAQLPVVKAPTVTSITPSTIVPGSSAVPFKIVGSGFLPGVTVTLPTGMGTATVTSASPDAILGTVTLPSTYTTGLVTVTNTDGGLATVTLTAGTAPTITAPTSGTPFQGLTGQSTTITITGTGLSADAVVTSTTAGVATFGAVTSALPANCTTACTSLVVPVTFIKYTGSTSLVDGFTVSNDTGFGSVTSANSISINPGPSVTGTYYVPTFSNNVQVNITGTGFENGMTVASSNKDYTVLLGSVTSTSAALIVSTDSNATSGTSSNITFTNPDGGTVTFALNGGPVPAPTTVTKVGFTITKLTHRAIAGKTVLVYIFGTGFYGQPRVTSNIAGTVARVMRDNGSVLTVRVTVKAGSPKGTHTFTVRLANGQVRRVNYYQG